MLIAFFFALRSGGVPVTLREFLALLEGLQHGLAFASLDDFYYLARLTLVKNEAHFDRFDRVFGQHFQGIGNVAEAVGGNIPEDWLKVLAERHFTAEEMARITAMGGLQALLDTLRQRLAEQHERHQGGNRWIGTAGTSPYGAEGYNPEGVRIGQSQSRHRRAVKVWDEREFRNYDDQVELGIRNIKLALRRLRQFAREGAAEHLDLPSTVRATANNAGYLDLQLVPERHQAAKVLLFLDVGGSMVDHIRVVENLFSAARAEFKHVEHFYFHNCVYEGVWRDNLRRHSQRIPLFDVLHRYGRDYRLILVGDAAMAPYEILEVGGSVEHHNPETGQVWLNRLLNAYPHAVWLNPVPEEHWEYTATTRMLRHLLGQRMYPLTLAGLDLAMRRLNHAEAGSALPRAGS